MRGLGIDLRLTRKTEDENEGGSGGGVRTVATEDFTFTLM